MVQDYPLSNVGAVGENGDIVTYSSVIECLKKTMPLQHGEIDCADIFINTIEHITWFDKLMITADLQIPMQLSNCDATNGIVRHHFQISASHMDSHVQEDASDLNVSMDTSYNTTTTETAPLL